VLKENGELDKSPLAFYIKNGFNIYPAERFESGAMSAVKIQWTADSDSESRQLPDPHVHL
jgi:hypothetical protein